MDSAAGEAIMNRMWSHTVGVVNEKRRVRTLQNGTAIYEEQPGTGSVIRWKKELCILTAKHVVEEADRGDLRFFSRPSGSIEQKSREDIERQGFIESHMGLRAEIHEIFRCGWEDIAVLTINPDTENLNAEAHDFLGAWLDPAEGSPIYCFGFPSHNPLPLDVSRSGDNEQRILGLTPMAWSSTVIPKPSSLVESYSAPLPYDPDKHVLVPWSVPDPDMGLYGFSGAAIWTDKAVGKGQLWSPKLLFAGMCTHYYPSAKLGRMIKASVMKAFLEEIM
jgi:hypothetical protein